MGAQFIVQSPKESSEYLVSRLNAFLSSIREKVATITEEELKVYLDAVAVKVGEKDYNLYQEHTRFWNEIVSHKYIFDRQARELEILPTISVQEFRDHFERTFYSPTHLKRLDFELNAAKFAEKQAEWKAKNAKTHFA